MQLDIFVRFGEASEHEVIGVLQEALRCSHRRGTICTCASAEPEDTVHGKGPAEYNGMRGTKRGRHVRFVARYSGPTPRYDASRHALWTRSRVPADVEFRWGNSGNIRDRCAPTDIQYA